MHTKLQRSEFTLLGTFHFSQTSQRWKIAPAGIQQLDTCTSGSLDYYNRFNGHYIVWLSLSVSVSRRSTSRSETSVTHVFTAIRGGLHPKDHIWLMEKQQENELYSPSNEAEIVFSRCSDVFLTNNNY